MPEPSDLTGALQRWAESQLTVIDRFPDGSIRRAWIKIRQPDGLVAPVDSDERDARSVMPRKLFQQYVTVSPELETEPDVRDAFFRKAFRAGFKAGFDVTHEGFNGQFPFDHGSADDDDTAQLEAAEDAALAAFLNRPTDGRLDR